MKKELFETFYTEEFLAPKDIISNGIKVDFVEENEFDNFLKQFA
jgi:hypothetical protein